MTRAHVFACRADIAREMRSCCGHALCQQGRHCPLLVDRISPLAGTPKPPVMQRMPRSYHATWWTLLVAVIAAGVIVGVL